MLREANYRVRELERQIGGEESAVRAQMKIKALTERLKKWWEWEGFGHVAKLAFGPYGCEATLSCFPSGRFHHLYSSTPVTDKRNAKTWLDELEERGFELVNKGTSDAEVADTDKARGLLIALLTERLPSARVSSLENRYSNDGIATLKDIVPLSNN